MEKRREERRRKKQIRSIEREKPKRTEQKRALHSYSLILSSLLFPRQGLASEDAVMRFEAFVLRVHDTASQQLIKEDELLADAPDDFLGNQTNYLRSTSFVTWFFFLSFSSKKKKKKQIRF